MEPIIKFQKLDVFQKSNLVLAQVDIEINRGEFVYLTGKTGEGKSSLLKVIYADIPAKAEVANIADFDLLNLKSKEIPLLRRKLGIIFQDFQLLFDRSVNDNLMFVLKVTGWKDKVKMQDRIQTVLESVGLGTKGFKMPNQLSGGEQQRVCIARALLNEPEIILADEPTGNLDPETSAEFINLLRDISSKNQCTVLMATHDFYMLEKFPARTLRCEGGKIFDSEFKGENIPVNQVIETEIYVKHDELNSNEDLQIENDIIY